MKRKHFLGLTAGITAIAAAVCITVSNANNTPKMSDLMTKNIEAISQGEWSGWFSCTGSPVVLICVGTQYNIIDTGYRVYL